MRQFLIFGAVAAGLGIASTSAIAQGVGIYIGPPDERDDYYYDAGPRAEYRYGPQVYGYSRRIDDDVQVEVEVGRPSGPGGCGTFHFWNGERCVDARDR